MVADYFRKPEFANAAIVSPDVGRASLAGKYAEYLNCRSVVMHKRRTALPPAKQPMSSAILRGCPDHY